MKSESLFWANDVEMLAANKTKAIRTRERACENIVFVPPFRSLGLAEAH
jgi:hypothetical protein